MKKTVRSIIENVQGFHYGLSKYFISIRTKASNERAAMLLDYLSRREELIAGWLEKYLNRSDEIVLNRWVGIVPWLPCDIFGSCTENLELIAPLSTDDILDIAIHYDDCLIDFLTILVMETEFSDAVPLFSNLLNQARKDERNLSRDVLWLNDI